MSCASAAPTFPAIPVQRHNSVLELVVERLRLLRHRLRRLRSPNRSRLQCSPQSTSRRESTGLERHSSPPSCRWCLKLRKDAAAYSPRHPRRPSASRPDPMRSFQDRRCAACHSNSLLRIFNHTAESAPCPARPADAPCRHKESASPPACGGDLLQPLGIGEHQVGALVSCSAARKSQRQHIGIQHQPGARSHFGQQCFFGAMRARPVSPAPADRSHCAGRDCLAATAGMCTSSICCTGSEIHVGACTPLVIESIANSGNMARETLPCCIATPLAYREKRNASSVMFSRPSSKYSPASQAARCVRRRECGSTARSRSDRALPEPEYAS